MQSLKFSDMWETVDKYSLQFDCEIPPSFLCVLCKNILRNAKQLLCGCRCCSQCLDIRIATGGSCCPGDSDECQLQSFNSEITHQDDNYANKEISKMMMKCISVDCDVRESVRNIGGHINNCPLFVQECPACGLLMQRQNLPAHLEDLCEEQELECEYCSEIYTRKSMTNEHHNVENDDVCRLYECACPYNCDAENQVFIREHLRVCTNRPILCPYVDIGCHSEPVAQAQMAAHLCEKGYQHTMTLLETISNLENEVRRLATYGKNNEDRLVVLETETERLKRENAELRQQLGRERGDMIGAELIDSLSRRVDRFDAKYEKKYSEYIWVVSNVKAMTAHAKRDPDINLKSDIFYTMKNGYRLQMILYLNGHGAESNRSISLYFQILKGRFDDLLEWPFKFNVEMSLLDQGGSRHHRLNLFFDPSNDDMMDHYQKPQDSELRLFGFSDFIAKNQLGRVPGWRKNNTVFIKFYAEPVTLAE